VMNETFLIRARWIVPVEPAGAVLDNHAVAVRGERIEAVLPAAEIESRYPGAEVIDLAEHVLIPGLVNAHTHAAMSLMRGLADDRTLARWLNEHIWPAEARHVSAQFVTDGTLLACAEMLRGGITCFNDMYFFPEAALEAALQAQMRAAIGMIVVEFPSAYASDPDDYLQKGLALRDRFREQTLLSFCLAPHAPYTVSDATFRKIATMLGELDVPLHIHLHETEDEIERSIAEHGMRPIERLRGLGLLGPGLIAVHGVHLTTGEVELLALHGSSVVHCPSSNLKLASGFAPLADMRRRGINVGLGSDGAASNNRLDVMTEMRTAALVAKAASGDARVVSAAEALEMATLGGARALGMEKRIGSIAPGKLADLAAVELSSLETLPRFDPVSQLVYAAGREHVSHVWVEGRARVADRRLQDIDEDDLRTKALWWQKRLS